MQTLYRFYDVSDELLYVGITMNPPHRFRTHAHTKEWWTEVDHITLEQHDTRHEVMAAESEAIRTECPVYNIAMNGDTVVCDVCSRAVLVDPMDGDEEDDGPARHLECDAAVYRAYLAGRKAGKEWVYEKTLGERIGHKLASAHCDGVNHAGVDHYRYRKAGW